MVKMEVVVKMVVMVMMVMMMVVVMVGMMRVVINDENGVTMRIEV